MKAKITFTALFSLVLWANAFCQNATALGPLEAEKTPIYRNELGITPFSIEASSENAEYFYQYRIPVGAYYRRRMGNSSFSSISRVEYFQTDQLRQPGLCWDCWEAFGEYKEWVVSSGVRYTFFMKTDLPVNSFVQLSATYHYSQMEGYWQGYHVREASEFEGSRSSIGIEPYFGFLVKYLKRFTTTVSTGFRRSTLIGISGDRPNYLGSRGSNPLRVQVGYRF